MHGDLVDRLEDALDLLDLLETEYFRVGLRLGVAALAVGWLIWLAFGRKKPPLPIVGGLLAAATIGGLYLTSEPLGQGVPAIAAILLGVLGARLIRAPSWLLPFAALPGAAWLAFSTPATELIWVRVLIAVIVPVGGYLATDFEMRHDGMGLGVLYFTLAVAGAFFAVPDTEQALIITAAAFVVVFLAWPFPAASLGAEGAYVVIAVFMVIVASGGAGRPPSIIGSAACLGLLLLEPIIVRLRPSAISIVKWARRSWTGALVASLPQFVVVFLCSRVAARFDTELPALVIVAAVYAVTLAIGLIGGRRVADARIG